MNPEEIKAQNTLKGKQAVQSLRVAQPAPRPAPQPSFTDAIGSVS